MTDVREPEQGVAAPARHPLWWWFGVDCALAVLLRLGLAWWTGGYPTDVLTFQSWAGTLRDHPLDQFYATAQSPDHLPGDLWLLKGLVTVFGAFGGTDVYGRVFAFLTQVVPTVADVVVALMLVLVVRRLAGAEAATRSARWYLLNPATIFLTGIWGQWDSVSLAFLLTGVWLLLDERRWVLSAPVLAWAVLVKPQLLLPALCFVALLAHRLLTRRTATGRRPAATLAAVAAWVGLGVGTAYAVLAPFGVHLLRAPAGGTTLAERMHVALGLYPFTTLGAADVWMLPIGSLRRVRDDVPGLLGVTPQQWGGVLLLVALAYVAVTATRRSARERPVVAACWASSAAAFAVFMLSTRVHERYVLPVLGLGLVLLAVSGFDRRLVACFWVASTCLTLNLVLVLYGGLRGPGGSTMGFGRGWWVGVSVAYLAVFAAWLAWPRWAAGRVGAGARPDSRRTPAPG